MVKIAGSYKSCPIRHKINRITASAVSNSTKVVIETKDGTVLITISDGKLKFEHPKELEVLFPTLNDIEEFDEKFGKLSKEASEQTSLDELYRLLLRKEECQNDIQSLTKIILPAKQSDTKLTLLEKCFLLLYVRTETSKIETVTPKTDEEGDEEILETLTCLAGLNGSQSALDLSHLFNDEEEEKVDTDVKTAKNIDQAYHQPYHIPAKSQLIKKCEMCGRRVKITFACRECNLTCCDRECALHHAKEESRKLLVSLLSPRKVMLATLRLASLLLSMKISE